MAKEYSKITKIIYYILLFQMYNMHTYIYIYCNKG